MKDLQCFSCIIPEKNTTKKEQVNDIQLDFRFKDNEKYEVKGIKDSAIYAR